MKTKLARIISILGHPLLTLSLFAVVAFFTYEEFQQALVHSALILGGVFLPISIRMYLKAKNGSYTNFDVSDKTQRQSWYIYGLSVLLLLTIILFITEQSRTLRLSVLFALILLATSQVVNYFIKSSLHVSLNIFLAFLMMSLNFVIGLAFLACVPFIAWSRVVLKRHSLKEIITGALIGLIVGGATLIFI